MNDLGSVKQAPATAREWLSDQKPHTLKLALAAHLEDKKVYSYPSCKLWPTLRSVASEMLSLLLPGFPLLLQTSFRPCCHST
jgi:hypothetical protein